MSKNPDDDIFLRILDLIITPLFYLLFLVLLLSISYVLARLLTGD